MQRMTRVKKSVLDGVMLAALYSLGMYFTDGSLPGTYALVTFMALFVFSTALLHAVDAEYADAIPRGAAIVIAAKYINSLQM